MKLGKNAKAKSLGSNVERNHSKNNLLIFVITLIVVLLIIWVRVMSMKAQQTVAVIMYTDNIAKNQIITDDDLKEYDMLKGEFDKYSVTADDGTLKRRILLWSEKDKILNSYAAYTLRGNTPAEFRDVITSKVDNSDSVLYSYPGKDVIKLDVGTSDLEAFKTFLQPGDRVNITAIYQTTKSVTAADGSQTTVDVYKDIPLFPDIMLADLLNASGDSILDIYANYNDQTTYVQSQLDADESFKESVTPSTMLVALTPEEEDTYYKYLAKSNISFRISLPQRTE